MKKLLTIFMLLCFPVYAANIPPPGINGQPIFNNSGQYGALTVGQTVTTNNKVLNETQPPDRTVTGTTDTILSTDYGRIVVYTNASSVAVTLPSAASTGFTQGFGFTVNTKGAGTVTITPASGTINGTSSLAIAQNKGCYIRSDGTNYQIDFASCNL